MMWCPNLLTWWRSSRSWRWRSMMMLSNSQPTFSSCSTMPRRTTKYVITTDMLHSRTVCRKNAKCGSIMVFYTLWLMWMYSITCLHFLDLLFFTKLFFLCSRRLRSSRRRVNFGICTFAPKMSLCSEGTMMKMMMMVKMHKKTLQGPQKRRSDHRVYPSNFTKSIQKTCFAHVWFVCFYSLSQALRKFSRSSWMPCWHTQNTDVSLVSCSRDFPLKWYIYQLYFITFRFLNMADVMYNAFRIYIWSVFFLFSVNQELTGLFIYA